MYLKLKYDKIFLLKLAIFLTLCIEITSVPLDFSIPIYGNVIGFIFLFFLLINNFKYAYPALFIVVFIFLFYLLINFSYYVNSIEPYKAIIYSFIVIVFSVDLHKKDYKPILEDVFFKYLIFITVVYFIGFGIDDAGGSLRIQGLMSEPSALSLMLCFLFWTYLKEKKYKKLLFVCFVCVLTLSLVVYAQLFIFYLIKLLIEINLKSFFKLLFIGVCVSITFYLLSNSESDFWLVRKASDAVVYTMTNGAEGKNTRGVDIDKLNEEQKSNAFSYLIGNGPNYLVYYYGSRNMLTTTQNIQSILFFNFGLIGMIIGLWWIIFSLYKLKKSTYYYLFISAVSYSLINTASGIVNDIYLYSLLFYATKFFYNHNFKKPIVNLS
jgi:hypothetical protein